MDETIKTIRSLPRYGWVVLCLGEGQVWHVVNKGDEARPANPNPKLPCLNVVFEGLSVALNTRIGAIRGHTQVTQV